MKADAERPETIAERIVREYTVVIHTAAGPMCPICEHGVGCWLAADVMPCHCGASLTRQRQREAIVAAIHAERAQTARLREKLTTLAQWVADTDCCYGAACMAQKIENRLREAAQEDRSHE